MIGDAVWSEYEALVEVMLPTLSELKAPDGSPKWNDAMTQALLNRSGSGRISSHAISRVVAVATSPQAQAQLAALGSAIAAIEVLEHGPEAASFYAAAAAQWSRDAEPLRAIVDIAVAQEAADLASASTVDTPTSHAESDMEVVAAAAPSETAPTTVITNFVEMAAIPRPTEVLAVAESLLAELPGGPWVAQLVSAITESGKVGGFRFELDAGPGYVLAAERDGQKGARIILRKDGADVTLRELHEANPEAAIGTLHPVIAAFEALPELLSEVVRVGRAMEELRKRLGDGNILVDAYFASASEAIAAEEARNGTEPRSVPVTRANMDPAVVPAFARTLQRMVEIAIDGHLARAPSSDKSGTPSPDGGRPDSQPAAVAADATEVVATPMAQDPE